MSDCDICHHSSGQCGNLEPLLWYLARFHLGSAAVTHHICLKITYEIAVLS